MLDANAEDNYIRREATALGNAIPGENPRVLGPFFPSSFPSSRRPSNPSPSLFHQRDLSGVFLTADFFRVFSAGLCFSHWVFPISGFPQ